MRMRFEVVWSQHDDGSGRWNVRDTRSGRFVAGSPNSDDPKQYHLFALGLAVEHNTVELNRIRYAESLLTDEQKEMIR